MAAWLIEKLGAAHDRAPFSCGHRELDAFLKNLVTQYRKRRLGQTYVATRPGETRVCGYYTVATGSFATDILAQAARSKLPKHPVQTIHLGRLEKRSCFTVSMAVSQQLGVFAVDVLAIDAPSEAFYVRYGFLPLADRARHLYLPMATIEQMFPDQ
jgi:hypothetical protein